jgi:predicted permease
MLASRITYTAIVSVVIVMNGWSLLQHVRAVGVMPALLPSTLVLNLILVPLSVWGAYKFGQMSEEEYRRKERETAALGAAAAAREKPARQKWDVSP